MVKHKPKQSLLKRTSKNIEPHVSLRIYCNGETEAIYFNDLKADLRLRSPMVTVIPTEYNRLSMVRKLQQVLKADGYGPDDQHEVWVVFDVDALSDGNQPDPAIIERQADEAVRLCHKLSYYPIVSNDAFELWFLLHFQFCSSHLHRKHLLDKVKEKIPVYEKTRPIYDDHLKGQPTETALKHSGRLCAQYGEVALLNVSQCKPYTNVHNLVSRMQRLAQEEEMRAQLKSQTKA